MMTGRKAVLIGVTVSSLLQKLVSAEDIDEETLAKLSLYYYLVLLFTGILSFTLSCAFYETLKNKDKLLPKERQLMSTRCSVLFWLIYLCCSCIGTLIFYLVALSSIKKRVIAYQVDQNSPVATTEANEGESV